MSVEQVLIAKGLHFQLKGNDYVTNCFNPEHNDKHPSLHINKDSGVFHCFSCGYKGNILKLFFNKVQNKNSETLLNKIRNKKIITLEMPEFYNSFIREFRGISAKTFEKFEAFTVISKPEELIDRIIFPIKDIFGNIIAFQGRHLYSDEKPKYITYPSNCKVSIYPQIIYNSDTVNIVEGIFDLLKLYDCGIINTIALLGCEKNKKSLSEALGILKIAGIYKINLILDSDEAGQKAASRFIKNFNDEFIIKNIVLNKKDPGELSREEILSLNL